MSLKTWDGVQWVDTASAHEHNTYLQLIGGTMTGFITLNADPTDPLHPATKQYVDALNDGQHIISTTAPASPNVGDVWVNPDAVDENAYLPLNGAVPMAGDLDMGGNRIVNVDYLSDELSAKLYLGADYALVSGAVIPFGSVVHDYGGMADAANNRIYARKTGLHIIAFAPFHLSNPPGNGAYYQVRKNGGSFDFAIIRGDWVDSDQWRAGGPVSTTVAYLNDGDYIDVNFVGSTNSSILRSGNAQVSSFLSVTKL